MLPKNWDDITLEQYIAIYKTLDEEPKDAMAQLDLLVKRVCLLTNLEPDFVEENCSMNDLNYMADFLKKPMPTKLIQKFRFNGRLYKVKLDPNKYKAGEYMAVMNACKNSKPDGLPRIMFSVCKEINVFGKDIEVSPEKIHDRIEEFKQLPLKIANPIALFFSMLSSNLMETTLKYSTEQVMKATADLQVEIDCLKDSDG